MIIDYGFDSIHATVANSSPSLENHYPIVLKTRHRGHKYAL